MRYKSPRPAEILKHGGRSVAMGDCDIEEYLHIINMLYMTLIVHHNHCGNLKRPSTVAFYLKIPCRAAASAGPGQNN